MLIFINSKRMLLSIINYAIVKEYYFDLFNDFIANIIILAIAITINFRCFILIVKIIAFVIH